MPALLIIVFAFFLRLFWISDMEFKGDEAATFHFVADQLSRIPYSPLAPIAENSGFAHSSGFLYFLRLISFGSSHPLWVASSIAVANGIGIAIGTWLNRKSQKGLLTFAMCATSLNLVLGSRKIWSPDLVPFWIYLSMGFFLFSFSPEDLTSSRLLKKLTLGLSAFCLILAGHMYMPGVCFALIGTFCIFAWLYWNRFNSLILPWILGCTLGWFTWIPYFYSLWSQSTKAFSSHPHVVESVTQSFRPLEVWNQIRYMIALPSPYGSERIYLLKHLSVLKETAPPFLLNLTLFTMSATCVIWIVGFLLSWIQVFRLRQKALKDGMLVLSISILLGTVLALQIVKLGVHLHYWLGAIPFAYYIMAWAYDSTSLTFLKRFRIRTLLWAGLGGSVAAIFCFFFLIRQTGGLEGEYKKSYRTQTQENRQAP